MPNSPGNDYHSPLPLTYVQIEDLPDSFNWGDLDGKSYLTPSLNQHLPHYCGSCWAHAAMSSLADRIKISRGESNTGQYLTEGGPDIQLSIQFILNCGSDVAGSCHGGSAIAAFNFIKQIGFVPYNTCQPYVACSSESKEGFCPFVDTSCSPLNTCRTCTNPSKGGNCAEISPFPNATVSEYGIYKNDVGAVMTEVYARGPVTTGIAGLYLHNYTGGIISNESLKDLKPTHEVSIIGWGTDKSSQNKFWLVRNSWGDYWGELSFFRIEMGKNLLGIESEVSWAVPGSFTIHNFPCFEDGSNCQISRQYKDPSGDAIAFGRRLNSNY